MLIKFLAIQVEFQIQRGSLVKFNEAMELRIKEMKVVETHRLGGSRNRITRRREKRNEMKLK